MPAPTLIRNHPAAGFVVPFGVFLLLLAAGPRLELGPWEQPLWVLILGAVLWAVSRDVISFQVSRPGTSLLIGIGVLLIWIAPDLLWPGYRTHWLFQNSVTGVVETSIPDAELSNMMVVAFRTVRAVILVPIIEELFWRGWLMRWLIRADFQSVPLGAYSPAAFWITAVLFASEHGPYWEVGLAAGIVYNWWIIRAKSLGDCILAHAATNAVLSAYVLATGKWEYWL